MTSVPKSGLGIKVSKNGPYLIFANDCMISCEPNMKATLHIKVIWRIIALFQVNWP